jgi:Spy/CpxP family protein refolding chaperone
MTGKKSAWLHQTLPQKFVTNARCGRSSTQKAQSRAVTPPTMKQSLMLIGALSVTSYLYAQPPPGGPHDGWAHHNPIEEMSESLNLTAEQKAKIQPIIDQARPQLKAIHEEAMTKAKSVVDTSLSQIRPLLTVAQQTKLDAQIKAHEDMIKAMKEMHEARSK